MRYTIDCDPRLGIEDPYELISTPEVVHVIGVIDEESAFAFRRQLEMAESIALSAGQKILPICIDSGGGCLYSLLSMIDAIKACSLKIATIIEGKAMSAAALLATFGDPKHRYMGEHATILLHQASTEMEGDTDSLVTSLQELQRLDKLTTNMLEENCNLESGSIDNLLKKNKELYLNAQQALELGLISHIGIPILKTTISCSHEFILETKESKIVPAKKSKKK